MNVMIVTTRLARCAATLLLLITSVGCQAAPASPPCEPQFLRLGDSPAQALAHLGKPSRVEQIPSQSQVAMEWWGAPEGTVIAFIGSSSGHIQTLLVTEHGRCSQWGAARLGRTRTQELVNSIPSPWAERAVLCQASFIRLNLTYPEGTNNRIEYTTYVPKAALQASVTQRLCADSDDIPSDASLRIRERDIQRVYRAARELPIQSVALRAGPPN